MEATKKPIKIEYYPFERKYHEKIMEWSTKERPIVITTPRCIDGKSMAQISTLEGTMCAHEGKHVIIRGIKGEVYPCERHIFERTYLLEGDDLGDFSDGYHTFNELYNHRITLYIALCKMYQANYVPSFDIKKPAKNRVWRSKKHSNGELCFGTGTQFVLGIGTEERQQITYHVPIERWHETGFAQTLDKAPEFDGHSAEDVLERLKNL